MVISRQIPVTMKGLCMHGNASVLTASRPMGRPKKAPTRQVRIYSDVADLAMIVAAYRRVEPGDMMSDILRPILQKMHQEELAKLHPTKK